MKNTGYPRIKSYCHRCNGDTNHEIIFSHKRDYNDDDYWEEVTYSIIRCCGCESISFHQLIMDLDSFDYDEFGNAKPQPTIIIYPYKKDYINPIDTYRIPVKISDIYKEAITALNDKLFRLAGVGFRAVVEAICKQQGIEGRNLESQINKLYSSRIITKNDRDRLHAIRFIGNGSIHILKEYTKEELLIVLDIINTILNNLYILEYKFQHLDDRPISSHVESEQTLLRELTNIDSGKIDTLRNFLKGSSKIIKEDIDNYEPILQQRIAEGKFTKLKPCSTSQDGQKQQYKVVNDD